MRTKPIWFNARAIVDEIVASKSCPLPSWSKYFLSKPWPEFKFVRRIPVTFYNSTFYNNRLDNFKFDFFDNVEISNKYKIPVLIPTKLDWEQISYQRTTEIENICCSTGKPLTIMYSGGIDSTYIVSCILKYGSKELINNTSISMSMEGFLENPYFTQEIILKRFRNIIDSKCIKSSVRNNNSITICGRLGDRIVSSETGLAWCILNRDKVKDHYIKHKDNIIDYIKKTLQHEDLADVFFEIMDQSARLSNLEIHTTYDLFWWLNFNFDWWSGLPEEEHNFSSLFWFDTDYYQQWSMQNVGSDLKFNLSTFDEKLVMKKFIYDIDKNEINLKFKVKEASRMFEDKIYLDSQIPLMIEENGTRHFSQRSQLLNNAKNLNLI